MLWKLAISTCQSSGPRGLSPVGTDLSPIVSPRQLSSGLEAGTPRLPQSMLAHISDTVRTLVYETPFPVPNTLAVNIDVGVGAPVSFLWRASGDSLPHMAFRFNTLFQVLKVSHSFVCLSALKWMAHCCLSHCWPSPRCRNLHPCWSAVMSYPVLIATGGAHLPAPCCSAVRAKDRAVFQPRGVAGARGRAARGVVVPVPMAVPVRARPPVQHRSGVRSGLYGL